MDQDELKTEWITLAPAWIREMREGANAMRAGLLDGPMLQACGDVNGLRVLDSGCGEGRFSRMLLDRGAASVLGLDLCPPMIEAAQALQSERDTYAIADVQDLSFLDPASFDLCVSYLNQCDLSDAMANNHGVFRVLKPGGRFVVANVHPMRSAAGGWCKTEDGEKRHIILDRYFEETARRWRMLDVDFTNFHRSLSTCIRDFLAAGFVLEDLVEPAPQEAQVEQFPELKDELRVPNFIIYVLKKP